MSTGPKMIVRGPRDDSSSAAAVDNPLADMSDLKLSTVDNRAHDRTDPLMQDSPGYKQRKKVTS